MWLTTRARRRFTRHACVNGTAGLANSEAHLSTTASLLHPQKSITHTHTAGNLSSSLAMNTIQRERRPEREANVVHASLMISSVVILTPPCVSEKMSIGVNSQQNRNRTSYTIIILLHPDSFSQHSLHILDSVKTPCQWRLCDSYADRDNKPHWKKIYTHQPFFFSSHLTVKPFSILSIPVSGLMT